ncbi:response regulator transcription factor [Vallitalea guaymasensis]|uniref:response regulator transcription factor n=1 Tax=Vallitalea guaymasensis TaxID=1185412 RepID=UPI000DE4CF24|nr:response regulator [Vallitalea guaymasensis]
MYDLIIVDDEEIIRNGLKRFIDWDSLNIKVVELFEDGKEAIDYLINNDVDIVLTDIKMADKTGLDIAKYLYDCKPYIKTVLISGYKEFEYAKKAIELNVENYVLKPTNFQQVNDVFKEVVQKLDKERKFQKQLPLLKTQFINDLIYGAVKKEQDIVNRARLVDFADKIYHECAYLEFSIINNQAFLDNNWNYGKERLNTAINNFFVSKKNKIIYCPLFSEDDNFVIFAYSKVKEENNFLEILNIEVENICKSIKGFMDLNLEISHIDNFETFFELAEFNKKVHINEELGDGSNNLNINVVEYKKIVQKYKLFFSKINEGNISELESLNQTLFEQLSNQSIQFSQKVIIDLFANLSNKFSQLELDIIKITNGKVNYNYILKINSIKELQQYCLEIFTDLVNFIAKNKDQSAEKVIEKAIAYIDEKFYLDISLEDVANHVFLNSVYFCRYFKQKTGETFTDYLTKVRMEEAIKLINKAKYKTYEISNMVGYKSSKYFSRVFKQYTGLSPSEYGKM